MADAHVGELVARSEAAVDDNAQRYHDVSLLAPEVDFIVDEKSNTDVTDRLMLLEQRLQMQEDEVHLLKMALADVLKKLNISEAQSAAHTKKGPGKASRLVSVDMSSRTNTNTANPPKKSSSSTMPSSTSARSPLHASKRGPVSGLKNRSSVPASRCPDPATSTTSACKKLQESKPKETITSFMGNRRVTHCKVTMQIYLSHPTKNAGPTEDAVTTTMQPSVCSLNKATSDKLKVRAGSSLSTQRSTCQSLFSPVKTPIYRNAIRSPSQYFQICY